MSFSFYSNKKLYLIQHKLLYNVFFSVISDFIASKPEITELASEYLTSALSEESDPIRLKHVSLFAKTLYEHGLVNETDIGRIKEKAQDQKVADFDSSRVKRNIKIIRPRTNNQKERRNLEILYNALEHGNMYDSKNNVTLFDQLEELPRDFFNRSFEVRINTDNSEKIMSLTPIEYIMMKSGGDLSELYNPPKSRKVTILSPKQERFEAVITLLLEKSYKETLESAFKNRKQICKILGRDISNSNFKDIESTILTKSENRSKKSIIHRIGIRIKSSYRDYINQRRASKNKNNLISR